MDIVTELVQLQAWVMTEKKYSTYETIELLESTELIVSKAMDEIISLRNQLVDCRRMVIDDKIQA